VGATLYLGLKYAIGAYIIRWELVVGVLLLVTMILARGLRICGIIERILRPRITLSWVNSNGTITTTDPFRLTIYGLTHVLFYAIGAYLVFITSTLLGNFWYGVILSFLVCFVLGVMSEQILKYLYGKTIEYTLIVTYAILIIGIDVIKTIWGVDYKAVKPPEGMSWLIPLLEVDFYRLFIMMVGITLYLLTVPFLRYVMLGNNSNSVYRQR
jgi:hypothetical protein